MISLKHSAILIILAVCSGCAITVDSMIDSAFETKEESQVRKDSARWQNREPLQHHNSESDLMSHREDLQFREWEKDRYTDRLREDAEIQSLMEQDREFYEKLKSLPVEDGLGSITDQP